MTTKVPTPAAATVEPAPELRGGLGQVILATLASTAGFWAWMAIAPLQNIYAEEMGLDQGQISLMLATPVLVGALGQRDAEVEHVRAALDLVLGDLHEAVVVVGQQQFLGLA